MSGKFALFFLVAVCLAQGFQAHVVESRSLVEDAIKQIKAIAQKIKDIIADIAGKIPELVSNVKAKIEKLVSDITQKIKDIPNQIQAQINKALSNLGIDPESVPECFATEKEEVKQLTDKAKAGIAACNQGALDNMSALLQSLKELKTRAEKLVKDSVANTATCIKEIQISKIVKCLKEHLDELKADADSVLQQVKTTNQKLADVPLDLSKCLNKVNSQALADQKAVVENFLECAKKKQE